MSWHTATDKGTAIACVRRLALARQGGSNPLNCSRSRAGGNPEVCYLPVGWNPLPDQVEDRLCAGMTSRESMKVNNENQSTVRTSVVFTSQIAGVRLSQMVKSCLIPLKLIILCSCLSFERPSDYFSVALRNDTGEAVNIFRLFYGYPDTKEVPVGKVEEIAIYGIDAHRIFVFPKGLAHMEISDPQRQKLILNDDQMRCLCQLYKEGDGCLLVLTAEMFDKPPTADCTSPPRLGPN